MSTTEQSAVTIRHAGPADAALLAELGARTFNETFAADNRPEDMAVYLASAFSVEQTERELSDPRSIWLVAEIDAATAGYAKLHAGQTPEWSATRRGAPTASPSSDSKVCRRRGPPSYRAAACASTG